MNPDLSHSATVIAPTSNIAAINNDHSIIVSRSDLRSYVKRHSKKGLLKALIPRDLALIGRGFNNQAHFS
jgi:hypothetical protein